MTEHLSVIHDPDLGTIAGVFADGELVATSADQPTPPNLVPYSHAVDALRDELAEQYPRHTNCRCDVRSAFLDQWIDGGDA